MFDIGASELLLIVVVAILVIGPKDLPRAMRTAGRWIAKMRKVSGHFRAGIDAMIREAELEDMEKEWKARNARIMREHPAGETTSGGDSGETISAPATAPAESAGDPPETSAAPASAETRATAPRKRARVTKQRAASGEPGLPFADRPDGN